MTGVPQIGCTCPVCTSTDPKDNRLRASAIVETDDARILIDCGPDFRTQVLRLPFEKIDGVLITHEHYDHIEGCSYLQMVYPNVKIIASEACSKNIQDERWNLSRFVADNGVGFTVSAADIVIKKDISFQLIGLDFYFLLTPGHSLGSMCFFVENSFFSGDMLIPDEKEVLKLKGGSLEDYNVSLKRINQVLSKGKFVVYPGHKEYFYYDRIRIQNINSKIR